MASCEARDTFLAIATSSNIANGNTTGKVAATTIRNIASAAIRSLRPSFGRAGSEVSATIRARIASISAVETRPATTFDSAPSMSRRPVAASGASRIERSRESDLPRSVTVRTRYMTASTRPHARLQPSAAMNIVRIWVSPDSATDTAPTKVRAMNNPKSISDTRSTGFSTGSRVLPTMTSLPVIAIGLC